MESVKFVWRDLLGLDSMKLTILKNSEKTICKQQDKECNGINCRECQFNKQGTDADKIAFLLRKLYTNILHKTEDMSIDRKATELALATIEFLLTEESYQKLNGEVNYEEREIE